MVVKRYIAEAGEAVRAPKGAQTLTQLDYDPVTKGWHLEDWQCFKGPADAKIWALKICGWLQYKYPDGPAK
jgi:hypothetical protein